MVHKNIKPRKFQHTYIKQHRDDSLKEQRKYELKVVEAFKKIEHDDLIPRARIYQKQKAQAKISRTRKEPNSHLVEKHTQTALDWINAFVSMLEWNLDDHTLDALRVVLHGIRDHLSLGEMSHFSAQLPLFIRGLFFEDWHPNPGSLKEEGKEKFIHEIQQNLVRRIKYPFDELETEIIINVVFQTLAQQMNEEEWEKLYKLFPKELKEFMS